MNIIEKAIKISENYVEDSLLDDEDFILSMSLPEKPDMGWYMKFFSAKDLYKASSKVRRLSSEEEKSLFLRYNLARKNIKKLHTLMQKSGDKVLYVLAIKKWYSVAMKCRQLISEYNLALVLSVMRSFLKAGLNFDDLLSEGNAALLNAINKFNVSTGNKFSTYATYAIRNALIHELKKHQKHHENCPVSLDPALEDGKNDIVDKQRDTQKDYLLEILEDVLKKDRVSLSSLEHKVIKLRYLSNKTYHEIGKALGITCEWARKNNHVALDKLKTYLKNRM